MPRIDIEVNDRVCVLKIICAVQMTFTAFVTLLYLYLFLLQHWMSILDTRQLIKELKWSIIAISILDFILGILLGFAANSIGISSRRRILSWIVLETIYIPLGVFLLMKLYFTLKYSMVTFPTDPHFIRIIVVHTSFVMCHFLFIIYTIDFIVSRKSEIKQYNPNIRPKNVHEPTDPQITTTESRHIRMCESFLNKNVKKNDEEKEIESDVNLGASTSSKK